MQSFENLQWLTISLIKLIARSSFYADAKPKLLLAAQDDRGAPRSFARVLHQAVERARVSKLQIFVSAPWNTLRCLCFHGEIVYRDINFFNQPFPSANSTHTIFLRQSSLLLPRGIRIKITWTSCDQEPKERDNTLLLRSRSLNYEEEHEYVLWEIWQIFKT